MNPSLVQEISALEALASASQGEEGWLRLLRGIAGAAVRLSGARQATLTLEATAHPPRTVVVDSPDAPQGNPGRPWVVPLGTLEPRLGTLTLVPPGEEFDAHAPGSEAVALYAQVAAPLLRAGGSRAPFLSHLSHELRTPLNGILGFSHLLSQSHLDAHQQTMVETIELSGRRLLASIDTLLELARFETGAFDLDTQGFTPRMVLQSTLDRHQPQTAPKGLVWTVVYGEEIPQVVYGDAVRLGQAWDQLVSNAAKFTEKGSIEVRLRAHPVAPRRWTLTLEVKDTGIGFDPGERSAFSPFHQVDGSLTRKHGGMGLGLALCQRIVQAMGGGVTLEGVPGGGTLARAWVELETEG